MIESIGAPYSAEIVAPFTAGESATSRYVSSSGRNTSSVCQNGTACFERTSSATSPIVGRFEDLGGFGER